MKVDTGYQEIARVLSRSKHDPAAPQLQNETSRGPRVAIRRSCEKDQPASVYAASLAKGYARLHVFADLSFHSSSSHITKLQTHSLNTHQTSIIISKEEILQKKGDISPVNLVVFEEQSHATSERLDAVVVSSFQFLTQFHLISNTFLLDIITCVISNFCSVITIVCTLCRE